MLDFITDNPEVIIAFFVLVGAGVTGFWTWATQKTQSRLAKETRDIVRGNGHGNVTAIVERLEESQKAHGEATEKTLKAISDTVVHTNEKIVELETYSKVHHNRIQDLEEQAKDAEKDVAFMRGFQSAMNNVANNK